MLADDEIDFLTLYFVNNCHYIQSVPPKTNLKQTFEQTHEPETYGTTCFSIHKIFIQLLVPRSLVLEVLFSPLKGFATKTFPVAIYYWCLKIYISRLFISFVRRIPNCSSSIKHRILNLDINLCNYPFLPRYNNNDGTLAGSLDYLIKTLSSSFFG